MQIEDLSESQGVYQHIYLSPHLDDAVLSCAGSILRATLAGERVLVVTLCTATPPVAGPFSGVAQELHSHWGLKPEQVVAARLQEDRAAMQRCGADFYWAGFLDAIYRAPQSYGTRPALFGTPMGADPLLPELEQCINILRDYHPNALIYAPLGVGQHVDHLLTFAACPGTDPGLRFYEDFPYASKPGALPDRLRELRESFTTSIVAIDQTLARKIHAINAYTSQIQALFGDIEAMARLVESHAGQYANDRSRYGERIWQRAPRASSAE